MQIQTIMLIALTVCAIVVNSNARKRVKRIVGGFAAAPPPPDDPVVFVRLYSRNARVEGFRDRFTGLYSFLGIRYAEPPIDENRFVRPQYKRLQGDINATRFGPPCPQPDPQYPRTILGHEDCLLLNVFTPQMPDESTGLPVLVFIHGGGFRYGSANQYGPDAITSKRVIFVPIQYRLGTLGIMGDGTTEFPGNVALFDMAAAVRWVNEYIKFFGGDPSQVSVIGHGSGATSAMHLTTSRMPRDLISGGVVAMSGTSLSKYCVDDLPMKSVKEVAEINNCPTTNETEIIHCLRKRDVKDIISQDSIIQSKRLSGKDMIKSLSGMAGFSPVIERAFDNRALPGILDEDPQTLINSGQFKKIRLLTGVTKHETANGIMLKDVQSVWSSATDFLQSLSAQLRLGKILNGTIGKKVTLPGLANFKLAQFLKIPDSLDPQQILAKLTETTTDALFNLPAILTAQSWSKVAPAFMYSFEYYGNKTNGGSKFLAGLPIVSKGDTKADKIVAHGDELAYLFDVRDMFGNPIDDGYVKNSEDDKVRDTFTSLIAKFAGFNESNIPKNDGLFSLMSPSGSSFVKIGAEASLETDFRYCQLSLWGASIDSAKTTSCAFLMDQLASLETIATNITQDLKSVLENSAPKVLFPKLIEMPNLVPNGMEIGHKKPSSPFGLF